MNRSSNTHSPNHHWQEYYITALTRTRTLTEQMLAQLEVDFSKHPDGFNTDDASHAWWGEKENALSVLTKLSTLLLKLIPAEQELRAVESTPTDEVNTAQEMPLSPQEWDLLARVVR